MFKWVLNTPLQEKKILSLWQSRTKKLDFLFFVVVVVLNSFNIIHQEHFHFSIPFMKK